MFSKVQIQKQTQESKSSKNYLPLGSEKTIELVDDPNALCQISNILYEDGFWSNSMDALFKAAKLGHTPAYVLLGRRYFTGTVDKSVGTKPSYDEAAKWLLKGTQLTPPDPEAQYFLGVMLAAIETNPVYADESQGLNHAKGIQLLLEAADSGIANAQVYMGLYYASKKGFLNALQYLIPALKKNHKKTGNLEPELEAQAHKTLGDVYSSDEFEGRDLAEAAKHYEIALDKGYDKFTEERLAEIKSFIAKHRAVTVLPEKSKPPRKRLKPKSKPVISQPKRSAPKIQHSSSQGASDAKKDSDSSIKPIQIIDVGDVHLNALINALGDSDPVGKIPPASLEKLHKSPVLAKFQNELRNTFWKAENYVEAFEALKSSGALKYLLPNVTPKLKGETEEFVKEQLAELDHSKNELTHNKQHDYAKIAAILLAPFGQEKLTQKKFRNSTDLVAQLCNEKDAKVFSELTTKEIQAQIDKLQGRLHPPKEEKVAATIKPATPTPVASAPVPTPTSTSASIPPVGKDLPPKSTSVDKPKSGASTASMMARMGDPDEFPSLPQVTTKPLDAVSAGPTLPVAASTAPKQKTEPVTVPIVPSEVAPVPVSVTLAATSPVSQSKADLPLPILRTRNTRDHKDKKITDAEAHRRERFIERFVSHPELDSRISNLERRLSSYRYRSGEEKQQAEDSLNLELMLKAKKRRDRMVATVEGWSHAAEQQKYQHQHTPHYQYQQVASVYPTYAVSPEQYQYQQAILAQAYAIQQQQYQAALRTQQYQEAFMEQFQQSMLEYKVQAANQSKIIEYATNKTYEQIQTLIASTSAQCQQVSAQSVTPEQQAQLITLCDELYILRGALARITAYQQADPTRYHPKKPVGEAIPSVAATGLGVFTPAAPTGGVPAPAGTAPVAVSGSPTPAATAQVEAKRAGLG